MSTMLLLLRSRVSSACSGCSWSRPTRPIRLFALKTESRQRTHEQRQQRSVWPRVRARGRGGYRRHSGFPAHKQPGVSPISPTALAGSQRV